MAQGIAGNLLQIVAADRRTMTRRVVVTGILLPILIVPAAVMAAAWGAVTHLLAAGIGAALGAFWAQRRYADTYTHSLQNNWNAWMKYAISCTSIPEVHHKVIGRNTHNRVFLMAAGLTALWSLELLLFAAAFAVDLSGNVTLPVIAVNALLIGAILGASLKAQVWYKEFDGSVRELVQSGEIGVWGIV